jgi:hypothetical protein
MPRRRPDQQPRDENGTGDRDGQQDPCEQTLGESSARLFPGSQQPLKLVPPSA